MAVWSLGCGLGFRNWGFEFREWGVGLGEVSGCRVASVWGLRCGLAGKQDMNQNTLSSRHDNQNSEASIKQLNAGANLAMISTCQGKSNSRHVCIPKP